MHDCACLDPKRFSELNEKGLPKNALGFIAKNVGVEKHQLQEELK